MSNYSLQIWLAKTSGNACLGEPLLCRTWLEWPVYKKVLFCNETSLLYMLKFILYVWPCCCVLYRWPCFLSPETRGFSWSQSTKKTWTKQNVTDAIQSCLLTAGGAQLLLTLLVSNKEKTVGSVWQWAWLYPRGANWLTSVSVASAGQWQLRALKKGHVPAGQTLERHMLMLQ